MAERPLASVSLDLDNLWSYMKTRGDPEWRSLPSYLDVFVPLALEVLAELELEITFFIVGQDAALARNREALAMLVEHGHEVANHSFHHEQRAYGLDRGEFERELAAAQEAIEAATGTRPIGYRGPGFTWNAGVLAALEAAGYLYDASTLPTYLGPLARRYYFRRSSLSAAEMEKRKDLFGGFREGRRPTKPYLWEVASGRTLLEIPVTTTPIFKTPFHLSYLLYLSRYSKPLMSAYLETALALCRLTGAAPSFLLHPLDLLGEEHAPSLAFFPGMDLGSEHKRQVFTRVLKRLGRRFRLARMSEHARHLLAGDLPRHPAPREVREAP